MSPILGHWILAVASVAFGAGSAPARRAIALDPGHGGSDLGAVVRRVREKDISLAMARRMRVAARGGPFEAALTRDADEYVLLSDRVERARLAGAAAFLSFHVDKTRGRARRGVVLYIFGKNRLLPRGLKRRAERHLPDPSPETVAASRRLALRLKKALVDSGIEVGELERGAFAVLKSPGIPSVLVELGNIRDPGAAARICDSRFQDTVARALLGGLAGYFSGK